MGEDRIRSEKLFTGQWGKLIEALVEPWTLKLFQSRGITVTRNSRRVKSEVIHGKQIEVDILAPNTTVAINIEVKTTLKVADVDHLINEHLSDFHNYFPECKDKQIYGAVAAVEFAEDSDKYAYRQGLFVLILSGDDLITMLNDKNFVPKVF